MSRSAFIICAVCGHSHPTSDAWEEVKGVRRIGSRRVDDLEATGRYICGPCRRGERRNDNNDTLPGLEQ